MMARARARRLCWCHAVSMPVYLIVCILVGPKFVTPESRSVYQAKLGLVYRTLYFAERAPSGESRGFKGA